MSDLVVDSENSETYSQRRRTADGRRLHCCCICGTLATWDANWSAYYSIEDLDDDKVDIPKFCSVKCRDAGGPKTSNVTPEMKLAARKAEWREPELKYRPATEREKYTNAVSRQRSLPPHDGGGG